MLLHDGDPNFLSWTINKLLLEHYIIKSTTKSNVKSIKIMMCFFDSVCKVEKEVEICQLFLWSAISTGLETHLVSPITIYPEFTRPPNLELSTWRKFNLSFEERFLFLCLKNLFGYLYFLGVWTFLKDLNWFFFAVISKRH